MIVFRADANPYIGMGHLMRCLSLADAFSTAGQEVLFILADNSTLQLVQDRGFDAIILNSAFNRMEEELPLWPSLHPRFIIVDSYSVTAPYLRKLKEQTTLVYFDDLAKFPYPVDVLINYNAYGSDLNYAILYKGSDLKPITFLGIQYTPLRKMFCNLPKKTQRKEVKDILISTGGADDLHVMLQLLRNKPNKHTWHLLVGVMNRDRDEIQNLATGRDDLVLHENIIDMQRLISSCDIAISAAGSTLYEICACGIPLITYVTADNQIVGADAFEKLGLAVNCGDMRNPIKAIERILKETETLASDIHRREEIGIRMQEMVDGQGAERLAEEILSLSL